MIARDAQRLENQIADLDRKRFTRLLRSKWTVIAAAVVAFVAIGLSGGCYAHKRPSALSSDERVLLEAAPLPYSVTVAWWDEETDTGKNAEAYGNSLARIVAASEVFEMDRYERSPTPSGQDLVATSTGVHCNTAVIPLFSIISLGVIPTIFQDEQCQGMLLRAAPGRPKSEGVEIEVRYKGPVIMGWAAVVVGALPGWAYLGVDDDSRFVDRFRLAVMQRRTDIERLVGR